MQKLKSKSLPAASAILLAAALMSTLSWAADTASATRRKGLAPQGADETNKPEADSDVAQLKEQVAQQQKQIEQLLSAVAEQKRLLQRTMQSLESSRTTQAAAATQPAFSHAEGQVASLAPAIPSAPAAAPAALLVPSPGAAPATRAELQDTEKKLSELDKKMEGAIKSLAGFRFSGDIRFRTDGIFRSGNSAGAPVQNMRERYRTRFNIDKAISDKFDAHVQLGSGTFNNPLTLDTDFAGTVSRGPIFLTEYSVSFHPNRNFEVAAGKMSDIYADNSRYLFDDDVRFNGVQEIVRAPMESHGAHLELRFGQYILTHPNVTVLPSTSACATPAPIRTNPLPPFFPPPPATPPANCAFLAAGYAPGGKVRDANLFHQGIGIIKENKEGWGHQFIADIQVYRNVNLIQLASTTGGFPVLVNGYYGVVLSAPVTGTGNGVTTKGGAIFTAPHFQVARLDYRLTHSGWKTSRQNVPFYLDFQTSRNVGTSFARNAFMGTVSVGEAKKLGDLRFLYQYAVKDANSMVSQFTDDDLGTGSGVNIRTHGIRVDIGFNKFLEWDNKLFIQDPVRGNDPTRKLFVPVPTGTNTSYRFQSEFLFKF